MSLAFIVPDAALPDAALLRASVPGGAEMASVLRRHGLPREAIARVFVPGRSTRGVTVSWTALEGLCLRASTLASTEDVRLALELSVALARALGLALQDADRTAAPDALLEAWPEARIREHVRADEAAIRSMIAHSRLRLTGVRRPVVLGPALERRVGTVPDALIAWLRSTQWIEGPEPLIVEAEPFGGDPDAPRVATMEPGARVLLGAADLVLLPGSPPLALPRADFADVIGGRARLFDEVQLLIEPIPATDWDILRGRARPSAIEHPATWEPAPAHREVLLPVLRPPGWPMRDDMACWPLHPGRPEGLPLVSLVRERPRHRTLVSASEVGLAESEALLAGAVAELESRLPGWEFEHDEQGGLAALVLQAPSACEALLSHRWMTEAHELLGASVLLAATPVRGVLRVERGDDPAGADPAGMLTWAGAVWLEASRGEGAAVPLSPDLMIVVDGVVQGRTGGPDTPESPSDDGSLDMPGLPDPTDELRLAREDAGNAVGFRGGHGAILALALPALGSLAAEPLVSVADTALVASLGDVAVGALGVSAGILSLAFVVFNFLAYGTTPLVAAARARGDREEGGRVIIAALVLAVGIGTVGALVLAGSAPWLVRLMGASSELVGPATSYLWVRALGAPAMLLLIAGHGAYRGFQDTTTPLIVSIAVALLNVVLDVVFLFALGWGVQGAAWASVIAQWTGAISFLALLLGPSGHQRGVPRALPSIVDLARLLSVGSVLSVRTLAVVGTMTLAVSIATRLGTVPIAAHQVVSQLWMLAAFVTDGLAVAAQALLAAAPTALLARQVTRRLLLWGSVTGVLLAAAMILVGPVVPWVFQVSDDALMLVGQCLLVAALMQPVAALVFVGDGLYLGARRFGFAAVSMVISAVVGVVGLLVLPGWLGLLGVWVAIAIFMVARAVTQLVGLLPGRRPASPVAGSLGEP